MALQKRLQDHIRNVGPHQELHGVIRKLTYE